MKFSIAIILLLVIYATVNGQSLHIIKFIHQGDETKPVGTLLISVEKKIKPSDRPSDRIFGGGVKTNISAFTYIRALVKSGIYTSVQRKNLGYDWFKIVDSDRSIYYMPGRNMDKFFNELKATLKTKHMDDNLLEVLKDY